MKSNRKGPVEVEKACRFLNKAGFRVFATPHQILCCHTKVFFDAVLGIDRSGYVDRDRLADVITRKNVFVRFPAEGGFSLGPEYSEPVTTYDAR